jgi:D-alanine transaminase
MPALAYVNGRYGPLADAAVSIEDRGLQFGDSIYEVIAVLNRRPLDGAAHWARLARGAAELGLKGVPAAPVLAGIGARLFARARLSDGLLYVQVTRGAAPRDHGFPNTRPTLLMTARRFDFRQRLAQLETGVALVSRPDIRWGRCDIKTTNLLPAVLAKQAAREAGAFEAMFVTADGTVTEGGSTNLWMVDAGGTVRTHPATTAILPGIARGSLLRLAREAQIRVEEQAFTLHEARTAPELFLTSTTAPILPVTRLDGAPIGPSTPGPISRRLADLVWGEVGRQTGWNAVGT